jgi:HAD superfamily hydrolase (TIGR01490 family)
LEREKRSREAHAMTAAAIFDLDNTLVRGSSLFHFAASLARRRAFSIGAVARFALEESRYSRGRGESASVSERAATTALGLVRGRTEEEMHGYVDDFIRRRSRRLLVDPVVSQVALFQRRGVPCFIATASPQELADSFARLLGMAGAFGTVSEISSGVYSGRLAGPICHGPAKARRVRHELESRGLDLGMSTAYSDSVNDLPLLLAARIPIAVSPDRALARIAALNGWPTLTRKGEGLTLSPAPTP